MRSQSVKRSEELDGRGRTVLGVLDGGVFDVNGLNGVVGAASDGSNGQAMATGACTTSEDNVLQSMVSTTRKEGKDGLTVPELTAKQSS